MANDTITKAFEYKIRRNKAFEASCDAALEHCRFIYNCALEQRIQYRERGATISYLQQSKQLTEARHALPEIGFEYRVLQQAAIKRLDEAVEKCFSRRAAGKKAGYPRYKSIHRYRTFWVQIMPHHKCPLNGDLLTVPGVGTVRVRLSRPIEGTVKQIKMIRRADGWHASIVCQFQKPATLPSTGVSVGIDAGLRNLATLSNGDVVVNPRFLEGSLRKIGKYQKIMARQDKRSKNRDKTSQRYRQTHLRVVRMRKQYHHEEAKKIVAQFDSISIERITVTPMAEGKRLWTRFIYDAGMLQFLKILTYKAENAGRRVVQIDPAYTSQTCSACGQLHKISINQPVFTCPHCMFSMDRDLNAALNILRMGKSQLHPWSDIKSL